MGDTLGINEEIAKAFGAHGLWKTRITHAIETGHSVHSPEEAARHDECVFGQWLQGSVLSASVRASDDYQTVSALHAEFHRAAGDILSKALAGNRDEARADLAEGAFAKAAEKLATAMARWQRRASISSRGRLLAPVLWWRRRIGRRMAITAFIWILAAAATLTVIDGREAHAIHDMAVLRQTANLDHGQLTASLQAIEADLDTTTAMLNGLAITLIALIGVAALGLSRQVTGPMVRLIETLRQLTLGRGVPFVPGVTRPDEIGDLARSVLVFQEQGYLVETMTAEREVTARHSAEERRRALNTMAERIEAEAVSMISRIREQSETIGETTVRMAANAIRVDINSQMVASAAADTMTNAETVATAAGELSSSIRAIAAQVEQSRQAVHRSVEAAGKASETITGLTEAMTAIDGVVKVIADIAAQTNLLALNATIESARAGEAGKGFAVVAHEVKNLANQTARQTEDITNRIATLNAMAVRTADAIGETVERIHDVEAIAGQVANAIEQQDAATQDIARNVASSSEGAREVTTRIEEVASDADATGREASHVQALLSELSEHVAGLGPTLNSIVRSATEEVNRRAHPRHPAGFDVQVGLGGQTVTSLLSDLSAGGACLSGLTEARPGDKGTLRADGNTLAFTVVDCRQGNAHVRFDDPAAAWAARMIAA